MRRTLDGVPLTTDQVKNWQALLKEGDGDDALADRLFALSHVHDGLRWVPLDLFARTERLGRSR